MSSIFLEMPTLGGISDFCVSGARANNGVQSLTHFIVLILEEGFSNS